MQIIWQRWCRWTWSVGSQAAQSTLCLRNTGTADRYRFNQKVQKASNRDSRMGKGTGTMGWVPETDFDIFLLRKIFTSYPFQVCIQSSNVCVCLFVFCYKFKANNLPRIVSPYHCDTGIEVINQSCKHYFVQQIQFFEWAFLFPFNFSENIFSQYSCCGNQQVVFEISNQILFLLRTLDS